MYSPIASKLCHLFVSLSVCFLSKKYIAADQSRYARKMTESFLMPNEKKPPCFPASLAVKTSDFMKTNHFVLVIFQVDRAAVQYQLSQNNVLIHSSGSWQADPPSSSPIFGLSRIPALISSPKSPALKDTCLSALVFHGSKDQPAYFKAKGTSSCRHKETSINCEE